MKNQSFSSLSDEQFDRLIDNAVFAYQTLYRSVLERKVKEIVTEINNSKKFKKKYENRIYYK